MQTSHLVVLYEHRHGEAAVRAALERRGVPFHVFDLATRVRQRRYQLARLYSTGEPEAYAAPHRRPLALAYLRTLALRAARFLELRGTLRAELIRSAQATLLLRLDIDTPRSITFNDGRLRTLRKIFAGRAPQARSGRQRRRTTLFNVFERNRCDPPRESVLGCPQSFSAAEYSNQSLSGLVRRDSLRELLSMRVKHPTLQPALASVIRMTVTRVRRASPRVGAGHRRVPGVPEVPPPSAPRKTVVDAARLDLGARVSGTPGADGLLRHPRELEPQASGPPFRFDRSSVLCFLRARGRQTDRGGARGRVARNRLDEIR